jgi:CHASE2 domain-containing sensor protein
MLSLWADKRDEVRPENMKLTTWVLVVIASVLFGRSWTPFVRLFLLTVVPLALTIAALVIWIANSGRLPG